SLVFCPSPSTQRSTSAALREHTTTRVPSVNKAAAIALPIPLVPPVTTATIFWRLDIRVLLDLIADFGLWIADYKRQIMFLTESRLARRPGLPLPWGESIGAAPGKGTRAQKPKDCVSLEIARR